MEEYNKKVEDILKELDSDIIDGLSKDEAKLRLEKHIQHISIANLKLPLGTNRRHDWAKIVEIYIFRKR